MNFLFKRLRWHARDSEHCADMRIAKDKILELGPDLPIQSRDIVVNFDGNFVYPGLFNSHDHLEFNLYPLLGSPPYANYVEWSKDIYRPDRSPIKEIQRIPSNLLLLWGAIKNLISGVTTVVHHNTYYRRFDRSQWFQTPFPIRVLKNYQWRHSLKLDKQRDKPIDIQPSVPFMIHAAEGIDEGSRQEIAELYRRGWLKENTVIIHGISIKDDQIPMLARANTSLVWCPSSNFHLFGQTAPIPLLKDKIRIALGTDSTLTGSAGLFEEMKSAFTTGWVTEDELFHMVTDQPAGIFKARSNDDAFSVGSRADFLVLPIQHSSYHRNLIDASPRDIQMVVSDGQPRLVDSTFLQNFGLRKANMQVYGRSKWICVNVKRIKKQISAMVPPSVLNSNSLWPFVEPTA